MSGAPARATRACPSRNALYARLGEILSALAPDGEFALAFSGGLDSRFLAHAGHEFGLRPLLLHVTGPHVPGRESAHARQWAAGRGLRFREFELNPLDQPRVAAGDVKRCYYCKHALFSRLKEEAGGLPLCDGTHSSDSQGYRPGLAALRELAVLSPLAEAGLGKSDIPPLGAATGLDQPDQRPRPCMLTRLDYGRRPTPELLRALDRGERAVEETLLAQAGGRAASLPDFRLRQVRPGVFELHLEEAPGSILSRERTSALIQAVERASGLPLAGCRLMPGLSGYFDRKND